MVFAKWEKNMTFFHPYVEMCLCMGVHKVLQPRAGKMWRKSGENCWSRPWKSIATLLSTSHKTFSCLGQRSHIFVTRVDISQSLGSDNSQSLPVLSASSCTKRSLHSITPEKHTAHKAHTGQPIRIPEVQSVMSFIIAHLERLV
jgi:hypothetical protein